MFPARRFVTIDPKPDGLYYYCLKYSAWPAAMNIDPSSDRL